MDHQTITANFLKTICWDADSIVDWAGGNQFFLNGKVKQIGEHYGFGDTAITSAKGDYVFIYKKLGTKGLLLKNGKLLREINRSYYCSDIYEYPAAFATIGSITYLIHCPVSYKQLDFEDVETGELVTNIAQRKPVDIFHSRLEISPDGMYLMSKGWVWYPLDDVAVYDLRACLNEPLLLDQGQYNAYNGVEICTASFVNDDVILLGTSDEVIDDEAEKPPINSISLWHFKINKLSTPVKVKAEFGNLIAIDNNWAWDLYLYPKIIDINTGEIISTNQAIDSGRQRSSLLSASNKYPAIIFNRVTKQVAISGTERIEVLSPPVPA